MQKKNTLHFFWHQSIVLRFFDISLSWKPRLQLSHYAWHEQIYLGRSKERQPCLLELIWPWSFLSWHICCLFTPWRCTLLPAVFIFNFTLQLIKSVVNRCFPPLHGAAAVQDPVLLLTQDIPSVLNGHLITFSARPRESYIKRGIHCTEMHLHMHQIWHINDTDDRSGIWSTLSKLPTSSTYTFC